MSDKPTLKFITNSDQEAFTLEVETFISRIKNPETLKAQFDIRPLQLGSGLKWYTAILLFSGGLEE